jgi:hypothetical protein
VKLAVLKYYKVSHSLISLFSIKISVVMMIQLENRDKTRCPGL